MSGKLTNFEVTVIRKTFQLPEDAALVVDDECLKNAGFCSTLKTVSVNNGQFNVVLKTAPNTPKIRELIPFERIFQREVYFYQTILKFFKKQLPKKICNEDDYWDCFPTCFYASNEPFKEILMLENLQVLDFQLWPRHQQMNEQHVKLVLKEYARLHAFSFALRHNEPQVLKMIENNTTDIYLPIIKKCGTAETIKKLSERVFKEAFIGLKEGGFDVVGTMERLVGEQTGDYGVVCHGDTWCNNLMFKYNHNRQPIAIKFLDFQLVRFGSPVLDLSYFLYSSASLTQLKHLNQLLKYYHDYLTKFLRNFFGCDATKLFPFEVLEEHWRRFAKFGLGMAFLVVNVMMMDDSELPDVNGNDAGNEEDFIGSFEKTSKHHDRYLERMVGILRHFEEWGLL